MLEGTTDNNRWLMEALKMRGVSTRREMERLAVLTLLLEQNGLKQAEIARRVGVSPATVTRYRRQLEAKGVEFALEDGRVRSGRKPQFEGVWVAIEELKKRYPAWGGAEIWAYLTGEKGLAHDEVPSVTAISSGLTRRGLCHRAITPRSDSRAYFREEATSPFARCGMDAVDPLTNARGQIVQAVCVRDSFSGAVYMEPFTMGRQAATERFFGQNPLAFAGVFRRFCESFEAPKVLVLDNGMGQMVSQGWLPEIARVAINMGTILEWEPPSRPWKNGAVERWHRDVNAKWNAVRREIHSLEQTYQWVRYRALFVNRHFPRRQLGDKTVAQCIAWRPWELDASNFSPLKGEPTRPGDLIQSGIVRMQREVEFGGIVQLHGNEYIRVQQALTGGYVRIDFLVHPGQVPGEVSVFDGKGNLVMTARHFLDCPRVALAPLIDNQVYYTYSMEAPQPAGFSQDAMDEERYRISKRKRAKGITQAIQQAQSEAA